MDPFLEHAFSQQFSGTLLENVGQHNPSTNVPTQSSAHRGFAIGYGVLVGGVFHDVCVFQNYSETIFAVFWDLGVSWASRGAPRLKVATSR